MPRIHHVDDAVIDLRRRPTDQGFTLVELAAVLLVLAILIAIAVPRLLSVSASAGERAAQSNLSSALTEISLQYPSNTSYATDFLPLITLNTSAPEFSWQQLGTCTEASGPNCVSEYPVDIIGANGGRGVVLATLSKDATCWYAADLNAAPGTKKFKDTGGTTQFLAGTANNKTPNEQEAGKAPLTAAGLFYSKSQTSSCDARTPVVKGQAWNWGSSYATAPFN